MRSGNLNSAVAADAPDRRSAERYFLLMSEVRPTIEVLKELEKRRLLPPETARALQHARQVDDVESRLRLLARLGLSTLDIPLLRDARSAFSTGRPDRQTSMTALAGVPVYEARDHGAAGWRGAVVSVDECAWLVYVEAHDRFHSAGPAVIKAKARSNSLGPSQLDLEIRSLEHEALHSATARAELLDALIDALALSARTTMPTPVSTPSRFSTTPISVQVDEIIDPEWDPADAHEHMSDIAIRLGFGRGSSAIRDELIRTCVPFLQPDQSMWEAVSRRELTVQVLVTRAGLMQLLATERPILPVEDHRPPPPTALHYTAKQSLTAAYVSGRAVRAVCGRWWVPIGDDATHSHLPICPDCEQESPFAQAVRDLLS